MCKCATYRLSMAYKQSTCKSPTTQRIFFQIYRDQEPFLETNFLTKLRKPPSIYY